jgi:hypothetical protein
MNASRIFWARAFASFRFGALIGRLLTRLLWIGGAVCSVVDASAERELHVVGVYEGTNGTTNGQVLVDRPGQSVTLFLSAYDAMDWQVTVTAGTIIERVFLNAYYHQSVRGIAAGVPVTANISTEGGSYLFIGYSMNTSAFLRAVPRINEITGQEISSFHGAYQAPATPFVINAVQNDPLLSADYPQPVPLSQLPDLHFQVATYGSDGVTLHEYTLGGPAGGGLLIPSGIRVSADAAARYYYGGDNGLLAFDSLNGTTQAIPLPEDVEREGWQMGTAFDVLRNRALVVTLAGEGFLYSFTPATQQWGVVSSMRNRDFDCLEYHGADDSLYGVTLSHEDSNYAKVVGLGAGDGTFRKEIRLPIFPFDIEPGGHRSELVSVGNYLVLLLEPQNWLYPHSDGLLESRIYLIDPRTGEVWLTYRNRVPPNKPPIVQIFLPAKGEVVVPGSTLRLTATAFDPDGTIASVEFNVDGASVGFGSRGSNGMFSFNWTVPPDGDHEIVAVAVDNRGATAVSDPVTIHVNRPPTVQMIAPESRASFTLLSSVQLVARSDDSDGSISAVEFMVDGLSIGSGARISGTNEFALLWTARDVGERAIKARARDNNGATAVSDSIGINVIGEASSAMRLLPAQYQGGRKFRVGIVVMPGRGTLSYSVAERPPAGWSASDISDGGTYDSAVGEVKFGPIPGDRVKLLTYSLKPPNNAKGIQIFSGELVADGVSSRIGGQQTIGGPRVKGRYLGRFSSR